MRSRAPWPQMAAATVLVMVLPAVIVGVLSALGVLTSLWVGALLAVVLSLALSSAGSAYWRRHATGDVLFSDLLLWGWLRRRRTERRLGRADELLREAGDADSARKAELLRELGAALDAQDPYLDGHSRRVARYVTMIGQRMNLSDEQVERAKAAATVHDVGKLRVPEEVVNKPGRLTDDEFELMKQHAAAGGEMVECLGDPALAAAVRGHHERWDGSGYPDGLAGERIPIEARIISVADTFDAITSARPYRAATSHAKALKVIDDEAGRQLDPDAARAFISCYSDRRGAALWAGLASIPRQVAGRLSTSPSELTGLVAAALTAPLVVVAAAAGAAAAPLRSARSARRGAAGGRPGRSDAPAEPPVVDGAGDSDARVERSRAARAGPTASRPLSGARGAGVAGAPARRHSGGDASAMPARPRRRPRTPPVAALPAPVCADPGEPAAAGVLLPPADPREPTRHRSPARRFPTSATRRSPGSPLPTTTPTASSEPEPTPRLNRSPHQRHCRRWSLKRCRSFRRRHRRRHRRHTLPTIARTVAGSASATRTRVGASPTPRRVDRGRSR